jgi:hypothetical protein
MFAVVVGVVGIIAFVIALILDLAGISHGHVDENTFAIAGWLCIAIYLLRVWSWRGWATRPGDPRGPVA